MARANSQHGRHHGGRKARREGTRLGSYFVACPRPKQARRTQMAPRTSRQHRRIRHRRIRHRGQADDTDGSERNCTRPRDADNIADKQTTQTAARGISTRLRVATVKRSQRQGQRTQFVRLGRRTATNERMNDRKTIALRIVNPPTHSCCAMPIKGS